MRVLTQSVSLQSSSIFSPISRAVTPARVKMVLKAGICTLVAELRRPRLNVRTGMCKIKRADRQLVRSLGKAPTLRTLYRTLTWQ